MQARVGGREGRRAKAAGAAMAEARALAQHARQLAERFQKLTGEKNCRACGQELTAEHFQAEKKRRDLDAKAAERKLADLTDTATNARKKEDELTAQEAARPQRARAKLRDRFKDATGEAKQAASDIERLTDSCQQTRTSRCRTSSRQKVEPDACPHDWSTVDIPRPPRSHGTASEVDRHRRRSAEAPRSHTGRRRTTLARSRAQLRFRPRTARESEARPPRADPHGPASGVHREADRGRRAVANAIKAAKKEIATTELDVDRQQRLLGEHRPRTHRDRRQVQARRIDAASRVRRRSTARRRRCRRAWQTPLETAGLAERGAWQNEFDALAAKGIEAKFTQLQAARGGLDSLRAEIDSSEAGGGRVPRGGPPLTRRGEGGADRGPQGLDAAQRGIARRPAANAAFWTTTASSGRNSASSTRQLDARAQPLQAARGTPRPRSAPAASSSARPNARSSTTPTPCSTASAAGNCS